MRQVKIPKDFLLEFTVYLFTEAEPELKLFLLSGAEKDLKEQLTIFAGRSADGRDKVEASVWDQSKRERHNFARDYFPIKNHTRSP